MLRALRAPVTVSRLSADSRARGRSPRIRWGCGRLCRPRRTGNVPLSRWRHGFESRWGCNTDADRQPRQRQACANGCARQRRVRVQSRSIRATTVATRRHDTIIPTTRSTRWSRDRATSRPTTSPRSSSPPASTYAPSPVASDTRTPPRHSMSTQPSSRAPTATPPKSSDDCCSPQSRRRHAVAEPDD